jgi:ADP-ribose pyrophosphatase
MRFAGVRGPPIARQLQRLNVSYQPNQKWANMCTGGKTIHHAGRYDHRGRAVRQARFRSGRRSVNGYDYYSVGVVAVHSLAPLNVIAGHKERYSMPNDEQTLLKTRRFTVVEKTVTRADGQVASVQYVKHFGSVAILPLLDDGSVCLIRSRRLTVEETLIEVPAGTRELDESPLETARRELAEETGYRAASFEELLAYFPSPGVLSERMWIFVAKGLSAGPPAREANEEIENLVVSWDEALAMVDKRQIHDGKTIVALLAYQRMRSG